jgi:hypothetical protein
MDGMPDAGLAQMAQVPDITALAKMQIDAEQAARNKMRSAYAAQQAQQQVPQQTVAQEVMSQLDQGLGAAPLPEEFFSAAGGGIVAMADGGDPEIERLRKRAEAQKNTVVPQNTAAAGLGAAKVPAAAKTKAPAQQTAAAESSEKSAKPVGGLRGAQAAFEAAQNEGLAAFKAAQPDYKTLGADYKAKVEGLGQYGVDRENDLAAQEESAQREFEQERWGALALGFAEMASTPGSLFEAIAAGAKVGSKELSTIQQAHKELKREIAKERALIAEKRRAEALGLADKVVEFDKLAAEQSLKIAEKQVDVKNAVAKSGIDVEQALLNAQTQKDVASTYAGSRSTATGAKPLTAAQKANIMNQATAAVDKQINEAPALRLSSQQNPGLRQQMITEEYARRLAVAEESPYSAPSSDVAPPTSGGLATQGGRPVPSGGYNDGWGQMTVR